MEGCGHPTPFGVVYSRTAVLGVVGLLFHTCLRYAANLPNVWSFSLCYKSYCVGSTAFAGRLDNSAVWRRHGSRRGAHVVVACGTDVMPLLFYLRRAYRRCGTLAFCTRRRKVTEERNFNPSPLMSPHSIMSIRHWRVLPFRDQPSLYAYAATPSTPHLLPPPSPPPREDNSSNCLLA